AGTGLPVWRRVMTRLLYGLPPSEFASDRGLEQAWIDPYSGGLARRDCPTPMRVPFLPGTAPRRSCTRDHTSDWRRIQVTSGADTLATAGTEAQEVKPHGAADTTATQPAAPPPDSTAEQP